MSASSSSSTPPLPSPPPALPIVPSSSSSPSSSAATTSFLLSSSVPHVRSHGSPSSTIAPHHSANSSASGSPASSCSSSSVCASPTSSPPAPPPPLPLPHPVSSHSHMLIAGLTSGVVVAGVFNPWDRALYLSVLHSRPFLSRQNFVAPYQGFWQVLAHRTLTGGLYFPLFDAAQPSAARAIAIWANGNGHSSPAEQSALLHFACGNFAGGVSGVMLNALTAIKYASWDARTGFVRTAMNMFRAGGLQPFAKGVSATVMRDTTFGGVFALTKFQIARYLQPFVVITPNHDDHHHNHAGTTVAQHEHHGSTVAVIPVRIAGVSTSTNAALQQAKARKRQQQQQQHDQMIINSTTTSTSTSMTADDNSATTMTTTSDGASSSSSLSSSSTSFVPIIQMSASTMDFTAALLAGFSATVVSSPFNYVRNIKYGWPSSSWPPATHRILSDLWHDARASNRFASHMQERLRLGWGTTRVAVGMAVGQYLYESTKAKLDERHKDGKITWTE